MTVRRPHAPAPMMTNRSAGLAWMMGLLAPASLAQSGIVAPIAVHPFFEAATSQRVDLVMVGDSNQISWKEGWDRGMQVALAERFAYYATGLMPAGENAGLNFGMGYGLFTFASAGGKYIYSGAPSQLDAIMKPGIGLKPHDYLFLPAGSVASTNSNQGLVLEFYNLVDVDAALRFHLVHATFAGSEHGSFRLQAFRMDAPAGQAAVGEAMDTNTGAWGVATTSLDVPAGERSTLNFRYVPIASPESQDLIGPFLAYYTRAENTQRPTGMSAHTLIGYPGATARNFAETLQTADDAQLTAYFSAVRALQGPDKHVMVRVNAGINDRIETLPSRGPKKIQVGNSPEAYADNLQAIIDRVTAIWALNAWDESGLYFNLAPSHPISNPDDPLLIAYRDAANAVALANPRTCVTRFDILTSHDEMLAKQWYYFPGDKLHLSTWGYDALSGRELDALAACPLDLDADQTLTIDDFIAFQTLFALGNATADIDDDGALTIDDFIAYQTYFALGCP